MPYFVWKNLHILLLEIREAMSPLLFLVFEEHILSAGAINKFEINKTLRNINIFYLDSVNVADIDMKYGAKYWYSELTFTVLRVLLLRY